MNGELTLGIRKRLHQELKYVVKVQPSFNTWQDNAGDVIHSAFHKPDPVIALERADAHDLSQGLYRCRNTLVPCLDLATRISRTKIPIILCGVSFDTKGHFYKNRFNAKENDAKKPFFSEKQQYTINIVKDYITYLMSKGYDISYTDESKLLKEWGCRKIKYSDITYTYK